MQKTKRKRAVYLALSGVCSVLSTVWILLWEPIWDLCRDWIILDNGVVQVLLMLFFIPLAILAVVFFVMGFVPARHTALKTTMAACIVLLGGYIAMVAFIKVDFINVWPVRIACGLVPLLAVFCILLFYGGGKWHRILCTVLASLTLCVSTILFAAGISNNRRDSIGYSNSPGGTHKIVVVRDLTTKWKVSVACPVYGLWYKQKDPVVVNQDILENIIWLDENTAQIKDQNGYSRTITFK